MGGCVSGQRDVEIPHHDDMTYVVYVKIGSCDWGVQGARLSRSSCVLRNWATVYIYNRFMEDIRYVLIEDIAGVVDVKCGPVGEYPIPGRKPQRLAIAVRLVRSPAAAPMMMNDMARAIGASLDWNNRFGSWPPNIVGRGLVRLYGAWYWRVEVLDGRGDMVATVVYTGSIDHDICLPTSRHLSADSIVG